MQGMAALSDGRAQQRLSGVAQLAATAKLAVIQQQLSTSAGSRSSAACTAESPPQPHLHCNVLRPAVQADKKRKPGQPIVAPSRSNAPMGPVEMS